MKPFQKNVKQLIESLLADETMSILTMSEGETISEETPNRDVANLVDDCYACDDCLLVVHKAGEQVGNVYLMPYEATEAGEIAVDWHMSPEVDPIMEAFIESVS